MNCKPGDLAVIVSSICGNEGRIVECVRLHPMHRIIYPHGSRLEAAWEITPALPSWDGSPSDFATDSQLLPITPPPGTITTEEVNELYSPLTPQKTKERA